jgi:acetylornithine/LysW-gamma-L-lysine aminotransferase
MNIQQTEQQHASGVYVKRDLVIVRAKSANVWDIDGNEYIDCVGGQGVSTLGHTNEAVAHAIAEQANTLITCTEIFYNDKRAQLLDLLAGVVPSQFKRFFLCNSGAEAIEGTLKFARLSTGRPNIIATVRGFHGRTMGALSATYEPKYREPFQPLLQGFSHVPFNNLAALDKAVNEQTAAVIVEPVQGEGGVNPATDEYLQGIRDITQARGALMIVDEVQTGFCRTGKWFAIEHSGAQADLMALGKAIGGGIPMGAVAIADTVKNITPAMHGSTFGGSPLACAAAIASINEMKRLNLAQMAEEKGNYFRERLEEINSPMIREVRGKGLLIGVELKTKVAPYLKALQAEGVLALPAGLTVLRFLPPAVITHVQIDKVVEAVAKVLQTSATVRD